MQYLSFTEQLLQEGEARGVRRGREEGREEWRKATLDLVARIAAPILQELQDLEDPEEMSRRLTEYVDRTRG